MKVSIFAGDGKLIWSRNTKPLGGYTSESYLRDGTQQKVIAALVDALAEARGQLGGAPLFNVVDAVADVGVTAAKVDCRVPFAVVRNRDAGR
jgi:hypothetical protein